VVFPNLVFAELFLEITKGSENPFRIALVTFEGNKKLSKELRNIITNDLKRTGEFSILDQKLLLPVRFIDEELNYKDWKFLGIDYLITGDAIQHSGSMISTKSKKLEAQKFLGSQIKHGNLLITPVMEFMSLLPVLKELPQLS